MESSQGASARMQYGFQYMEDEQSCFYFDKECMEKGRKGSWGIIGNEKERRRKKEMRSQGIR